MSKPEQILEDIDESEDGYKDGSIWTAWFDRRTSLNWSILSRETPRSVNWEIHSAGLLSKKDADRIKRFLSP